MNYDFLPKYLRVYAVQQEYSSYSAVDHSTWRFILKISKNFFISNAHSAYLNGLKETGISEDKIPRIEDIDRKLKIGSAVSAKTLFKAENLGPMDKLRIAGDACFR